MYNDQDVRRALRKRPTYFVGVNLDERITKKDFLKHQEDKKEATYIRRAFLVKTRTFTPAKLTSYEKRGMLIGVKDNGVTLYKKEDVARIIEIEAGERRSKRRIV